MYRSYATTSYFDFDVAHNNNSTFSWISITRAVSDYQNNISSDYQNNISVCQNKRVFYKLRDYLAIREVLINST